MIPDLEGLEAVEGPQGASSWEGPIWTINSSYNGEILEWFKRPHDWVNHRDHLYRIRPDERPHGTIIINSPANGYLLRIFVERGRVIEGITPVCEILVHSVPT